MKGGNLTVSAFYYDWLWAYPVQAGLGFAS